jgi:hypothetical protein
MPLIAQRGIGCPITLTSSDKENTMFLVRDIMYCKPGQARPMVQKHPHDEDA